jgi:hypothetical protein
MRLKSCARAIDHSTMLVSSVHNQLTQHYFIARDKNLKADESSDNCVTSLLTSLCLAGSESLRGY